MALLTCASAAEICSDTSCAIGVAPCCDMTRFYVTWLVRVWHDAFICDMSWRCSFLPAPRWLALTCSAQLGVVLLWSDTFICDMTMARSSLTWLIHINESCHVWMSKAMCERALLQQGATTMAHAISYMNESCHIWTSYVTYERVIVMSRRRKACWNIEGVEPGTRKDLANRTWGGSGTNPK